VIRGTEPPVPPAVPFGQTKEVGMYGSEMAKERIGDLVREADAYRRSRGARASRAGEMRGRLRRVTRGVVTALLWPIRH
jgi:hypothetical protein